MNRRPKRNAQLSLARTSGWGGRRAGAGRPNRSGLVSHGRRLVISNQFPLHITMRLKPGLPSLRQKALLAEFKRGIQLAGRKGLAVLQFSLQGNHIHLIAEAENNSRLGAGVQSLAGRFAKIVRRRIGGRGSIFSGRYHMRILPTPTEMKRALEYVLLNSAKHGDAIEHIDRFSSGVCFKYWPQLLGRRLRGLIRVEAEDCRLVKDPPFVIAPRSWLAKSGWMRAKG